MLANDIKAVNLNSTSEFYWLPTAQLTVMNHHLNNLTHTSPGDYYSTGLVQLQWSATLLSSLE